MNQLDGRVRDIPNLIWQTKNNEFGLDLVDINMQMNDERGKRTRIEGHEEQNASTEIQWSKEMESMRQLSGLVYNMKRIDPRKFEGHHKTVVDFEQ